MAKAKAAQLGEVNLARRSIAALRRAAYNPRKIGASERAALAASIDRFGLVQPVIVNQRTPAKGWPEGSPETVVGGHQRLDVLVSQGASETDVVLVDLTAAEEKALNVALNSRTAQGEFTAELGGLLEELGAALPELSSALGFPGLVVDAAKLSAKAGGDLAAIVEPALLEGPAPVTQLGDLWELGSHRLLCGDATKLADVQRVLDGARADLVNTDPPYGVAYEAPSGKHEVIAGDALTKDALLGLLVPAFKNAAACSSEAAGWYVWHASSTRREFDFALAAAGLVELQYIVWAKPSLVLGHADYQWAHEPCYYAGRAGKTPAWYGGRDQLTVWRIEQRTGAGAAVVLGPGVAVTDGSGDEMFLTRAAPKGKKVRVVRVAPGERVLVHADERRSTVWEVSRDSKAEDHPTQKPVALAARAILNSSKEGDRVLDLFAGAGFTLLAAEQLRRVAHVIELSPAFCDRIVARWEALSGRKATRHGSAPAKPAGRRRSSGRSE